MRTTSTGIGIAGNRAYLRSILVLSRGVSQANVSEGVIEFSTAGGGLLGRLRSDVGKSIVQGLTFRYNENGCADFSLRLSAPPPFEVQPFSLISFKVFNTEYGWYKGQIENRPDFGTEREFYEYSGVGLVKVLDRLRADTDYSGAQDIGEVIDDLAFTWIRPFSNIGYNPSKILQATGRSLINNIELSKLPIKKVLDSLARMAGCEWGVDGDGEFYFNRQSDEIVKTYFVGKNLQEFLPDANENRIVNAYILQRQEPRASGGNGWAVAGVYNDQTSQKIYGLREEVVQIPGYWSDADADVLGAALLAANKDPIPSAAINGIPIDENNLLLQRGTYRFILPLSDYWRDYDKVEDKDDWTVDSPGDLVLANDTSEVVFGAQSLLIEYQNAQNAVVRLSKPSGTGKIKKIRFYLRTNNVNALLRFGVGQSVWNEYEWDLALPLLNQWFPVEFDLSNLGLTSINNFGIQVLEDADVQTQINLDKIDMEVTGFRTYRMQLRTHRYNFAPDGRTAGGEWGQVKQKLEDYVAALYSAAQEMKFISEIR
jgi:hypothetical protein